MAIGYQHQMELLKDILENQMHEQYGTHDEFHQLQSLVNSLLQNPNTPAQFKQTLLAIEQFAWRHDREGEHANFTSEEVTGWLQQVYNAGEFH